MKSAISCTTRNSWAAAPYKRESWWIHGSDNIGCSHKQPLPHGKTFKKFSHIFSTLFRFFRGSSQAKSEETKTKRRIKIRTLNSNAKNTFCSSRKSWMNVFLAMYFAIIEFAFSKIDCQYPILYNTFVRQKKVLLLSDN